MQQEDTLPFSVGLVCRVAMYALSESLTGRSAVSYECLSPPEKHTQVMAALLQLLVAWVCTAYGHTDTTV